MIPFLVTFLNHADPGLVQICGLGGIVTTMWAMDYITKLLGKE